MGTTSLTLYGHGGRVLSVVDIAVGPDVQGAVGHGLFGFGGFEFVGGERGHGAGVAHGWNGRAGLSWVPNKLQALWPP